MSDLIIYGAGGMARELAWLAEATGGYRVVAMIDDDPARHGVLNGIQVIGIEHAADQFRGARYVVGVGGGHDRRRLASRCDALGLVPATLVHTRVEHSRWIKIGGGTVICAGSLLTTNIRIGAHVQINLACTISHDVDIGDFVTFGPGVRVTGRVRIEAGVTIGTGAILLPGPPGGTLVVGENAVIGAGAVVTKSVGEGATVVGVPARPR